MSLLSYAGNPSLFVASIGGITLGVTLLLLPWKSMSSKAQGFSTGNCQVIDMLEGVKQSLPKNNTYVALACKNSRLKTQDLINWVGYFPITLLKEGYTNLKSGDRVSIEVRDIEDLKSDPEKRLDNVNTEPLWTLFESYQFKKRTLIGNWGNTRAQDEIEGLGEVRESDDVLKTVYRVKLPELSESDKFYLQY